MRYGAYPKVWVFPSIGKFNLYWVVAFVATWAPGFEYGFGTLAVTAYMFQNQLGSLIPRNSRRTASFTEGSHFPLPQHYNSAGNTVER